MNFFTELKSYFKVGFIRQFIYRGSVWVDLLSRLISMAFMFFLWIAIFDSKSVVGGMTLSSMLVYYIFAYIVRTLSNTNTASMLGEQIKSGKLQVYITKPIRPLVAFFGMNLPKRISEAFPFLIVALGLLLVVFPRYHIETGSLHYAQFSIFLILAIILGYLIGTLVGLTSFWIKNNAPLTYGLNPLTAILSGLTIPISFFPGRAGEIISAMPFKYLTSVPVLALQGKIPQKEFASTLIVGVIWTTIFLILVNLVWRKGIKHFDAVGN